MKHLKLYEDFESSPISEESIRKCIKMGKTIDVEIVQGKKGKPDEPLRPVSIEDGIVTVEIDGELYEVELDDVKKINFE